MRGMGGVFLVGEQKDKPVVPKGLFDSLKPANFSSKAPLLTALLRTPKLSGPGRLALIVHVVLVLSLIGGCAWWATSRKSIESSKLRYSGHSIELNQNPQMRDPEFG